MAAEEQAEPLRTTLYKTLTADGHSPYITSYTWSLPTQDAAGAWTPGAWHEEAPESVGFKGLHLTPCPSRHRYSHAGGLVCEVEAEGIVGDPTVDGQVLGARVRLLRVVPEREWRAAEDRWEADRHVHARRAEVKERLDTARVSAVATTKALAAERAAGVESPALLAFKLLVELTPADSWVDVNGSRREALRYAVRRLRMNPDDVGAICKGFGGNFWLDAENLYSEAIEAGNKSACVALEKFLDRKPWWFARHGDKRERLHVGSQVRVDGAWHTITSFREGYLNAKRETGAKVYRITRDMLAGKTAAGATA